MPSSLNASEDDDCRDDEPELPATTAYTDAGLDESDTGIWTLLGGAETA